MKDFNENTIIKKYPQTIELLEEVKKELLEKQQIRDIEIDIY
jgi:hypothetical protein